MLKGGGRSLEGGNRLVFTKSISDFGLNLGVDNSETRQYIFATKKGLYQLGA
jgi:hypothetical protein